MSHRRTNNKNKYARNRNRWHILFGALLKESLSPLGIDVLTEVQVIQEPPKADVILIRRKGARWSQEQKLWLADGIRDTSAKEVLIEFKFSESLNISALRQLLVYDHLYRITNPLEDVELSSFLVSSRTPKKGLLKQLGFEPSGKPGVYTGKTPLIEGLKVILLNELADKPHNAVLKTFASRLDEYKKAFTTIKSSRFFKLSQSFSATVAGLRRLRMGEITLEHDSEEWTPEFLMELGKEWIKEATLEQTLQKGLQKGEASMLLTFLEECFGTLPTWAIEKVQAADHSTKEMWMRRAAKAQSLKEIFMD